MQGHTTANVYAGGATFDTNRQNVVVNQALVAPAGSGVSSIAVTTGGAGYRAAPIVRISGGGGVGATAVAQVANGAVTGITITNPGTGYTSNPTIDLIANGGTSAAALLVPYNGTAATLTPSLTANTSGGITKNGKGKLTLTGNNTYTGVTTINDGTLLLGASSQNAVMNLGGADIKGGALGFDYTGGTSPASTIVPILAAGYANNFATGQIHSSAAGGNKGLGYKDNGTNEFDVALTFFGVTNLDGVVNSGDFDALALAYNSVGGWDKGDFNYDGVVNALDFNTLATNYGSDLNPPPPGLGTLVPEPMSMGLNGIGALGLMRRRKAIGS
jgi:autotransporter-associated beta strand protein